MYVFISYLVRSISSNCERKYIYINTDTSCVCVKSKSMFVVCEVHVYLVRALCVVCNCCLYFAPLNGLVYMAHIRLVHSDISRNGAVPCDPQGLGCRFHCVRPTTRHGDEITGVQDHAVHEILLRQSLHSRRRRPTLARTFSDVVGATACKVFDYASVSTLPAKVVVLNTSLQITKTDITQLKSDQVTFNATIQALQLISGTNYAARNSVRSPRDFVYLFFEVRRTWTLFTLDFHVVSTTTSRLTIRSCFY